MNSSSSCSPSVADEGQNIMEDLEASLRGYNEQLAMVEEALQASEDVSQRESLQTLRSELQQLIQLTQESIDAHGLQQAKADSASSPANGSKDKLDEEYALFMEEMASADANETQNEAEQSLETDKSIEAKEDDDIEDELATLLGMKCAVYHTHAWGGQPSLHNAMVCAVVPRNEDDQFTDLQVRVLFTHPTHAEMLPCPFFLEGECKFDDERCRYSHGTIVPLSGLKEAIEPNFETVRCGSRVLLKIKPSDDEDVSLAKKSTEKYHLWHRAIVKSIDVEKRSCLVKLEHGVRSGEKRKSGYDELAVNFEEIFPLNNDADDSSDSDSSLSDTEYPESKAGRCDTSNENKQLADTSLVSHGTDLGAWERHTRGIGSKLMLAMGYVPGGGLGSAGAGRVEPVEARLVPKGRSLDHCMALTERGQGKDPLKVAQKLQRLQKKEEDRNKRAYEREIERERRNVFNFINKTLGDKSDDTQPTQSSLDIRQSTSKQLNVQQFKITEDVKKVEREISKLNNSLSRHSAGSTLHKNINLQISDKTKELENLRRKEQQISKEQNHRKDKQKMTIF